MNSAKLNDWMQVAGIFALVASLIFVGMQMKQEQEIAIASQYHDRATLAVENFHAMAELGMSIGTALCPVEPTEDRSAEDIRVVCLIGLAYLVMADNHLYQYESGFMDESAWQAQRRLLKLILSRNDIYRILYQNTRGMRRESFLQLGDQLIAEGNADRQSN